MVEKDTIAAQVRRDSPLHEQFEEYQEEQKFESRSEAVRALLRAGLDAHHEEQKEHQKEARTVTAAEEWCQEKARAWAGMAVLSAVGFSFLFLVFTANYFGFTIVPDWPISLAMFASLFAFVIFGGGSAAAVFGLRTGFVRDFAQWQGGGVEEDSVEA